MANTTGKKIKDAAIIGGCASLIYLTIGDISYRLSLSRGGLNCRKKAKERIQGKA